MNISPLIERVIMKTILYHFRRCNMLYLKKCCLLQTRKAFLFGMMSLVLLGLWNTPINAEDSDVRAAKALSNTFASVAKSAMPAVVSIKVEKTVSAGPAMGFGSNDPFGQFNDEFLRKFFGQQMPSPRSPQKYQEKGQGSGFIISPDGYILTNNHVVGNVDKITVELKDGRKFENAKVIGTDPDSEVALIKIEGDHFPVLPMGNSDKMEIGDWVMAIGNPFGLTETVTVGVVSAVGRSNVHIAAYEDFIQTDAAINPGNSGGPLINLDGQVIGINTAIFSESGGYMGIGFAIPINMAKTIEEQLVRNGKVTRGYLGLSAQNVTEEMKDLIGSKTPEGVIIADIVKGSPADQAGLKPNDIILKLDGKKIDNYDTFRNDVAMLAPGSKSSLLIQRGGKEQTITVTLGERPTQMARGEETGEKSPEQLGLQVQNLTSDLAQQFGYSLGEGVIVTTVVPGSEAESEGIQAGDLIVSVDRNATGNVEQFTQYINAAKSKGRALLLVKHGQYSRFVVLQFK